MDIYSPPIISTNSDLILVSDYPDANNSLLWYDQDVVSPLIHDTNPVNLFCPLNLCDSNGAVIDPQNLSFSLTQFSGDSPSYNSLINGTSRGPSLIDYCLSKCVREHCKLQFSLTIMVVIIVCNMIKTACMTIILWKQDPEPLVTLGDAIASFLDRPDVTTKRNCIVGRTRF